MKNQLDSLQKLAAELGTEEGPLKLVLVDWASEEQHKGNGTPLRDNLDVPVLQSTFWNHQDCIVNAWCRPEPKNGEEVDYSKMPSSVDQWLYSLILIDRDGKALAAYPLDEGKLNGKNLKPVDLKKEKSYQRVKKALSKALLKAQTEK